MDIKTDVNTVNLKKVKKGDIVKFRHGGIDIILAKKKNQIILQTYIINFG